MHSCFVNEKMKTFTNQPEWPEMLEHKRQPFEARWSNTPFAGEELNPSTPGYERSLSDAMHWQPRSRDNDLNLAMLGPNSIGKTRTAYSVIYRWMRPHYGMKWEALTAVELGEHFDDKVYTDTRKETSGRLKWIRDVHLLLIDDIGRERDSKRVGPAYFDLMDYRYKKEKCTIWTSNLNENEFTDMFGKAVASRMLENATVIES